ncbi:MAG: hypothetical protein AB7E47_05695 [Desulfovibrionaceae bacterium]
MTHIDKPTEQPAAQAVDQETRLKKYMELFEKLKERSSIRELVERDMLMECIRLNQDHINEYPLLATQQNSIIEFLCRRREEDLVAAYVQEQVSLFLQILNKYSKAVGVGDTEMADLERANLLNQEAILVKIVQGAVYAMSFVNDNYEEVVLTYFGSESLEKIDEILEGAEMNEAFWKRHIEWFVARQIEDCYGYLVAEKQYAVSQPKGFVVVSFPFDAVLARLRQTQKDIKKTRVQEYFETQPEPEQRQIIDLVAKFLQAKVGQLGEAAVDEGSRAFVARLASFDPAAKALREHTASLEGGTEDERPSVDQLEYVRRQVRGVCAGALVTTRVVREDFAKALGLFSPKETETIRRLVADFGVASFEKTLLYMLQAHLMRLLMVKGEAFGGKIQVRTAQARRAPKDVVRGLEAEGLNRIRRNMLFDADASREDMLLFKARTGAEFKEQLSMLGLEDALTSQVVRLWDSGPRKIDVALAINMALLAKTSTNLKAKLAEVFAAYGLIQANGE